MKGSASFTLREVARRAGVSHNAPYHHYESVEDLLASVATEGYKELLARNQAAASSGRTPLESITRLGVSYVQFALEKPDMYRVMFDNAVAPGRYPELDAVIDENFAVIENLVNLCRTEGMMRGATGVEHAQLCWAMAHGLAKLLSTGRLKFQSDSDRVKFIRFCIKNALGHWPYAKPQGTT